MQITEFRQIPELLAGNDGLRWLAEEGDFAACRGEQAKNHLDGRRLTTPIRTQQAEDFAAIDAEVESLHRLHDGTQPEVTERLRDTVQFDDGFH